MIFMAGSLLYFGQTTTDWYKASTIHLTLCGLSPPFSPSLLEGGGGVQGRQWPC